MEGIKILETIVTPITEMQNVVIAMAITLVATGFCITYGIHYFLTTDRKEEGDWDVIKDIVRCLALVAIPFVVLGTSVAFIVEDVVIGEEYTYKVTISEDVSFVEFYSKYEVLEQDGLIYTIKEKATEAS